MRYLSIKIPKKKTVIVVLCSILLLTLALFVYYNNVLPDEYISITSSKEDVESGKITTTVSAYDIKTKQLEDIYSFEYSAQYPLGCYDRKMNAVYFTKRVQNAENTGDQIFMVDLKTSNEKQLTTELFAVNYILPDENDVFFVGRPQNSQVLKLGHIDIGSGKIEYWGDDDTNIEAIALDRKNKEIVISAYSEKERAYNVAHQDGPIGQDNMKMPKHTVYEIDYDFGDAHKLFDEELWIRTVMVNNDDIYALCDRKYNNSSEASFVYRYNRNDKTIYTSEWSSHRLQIGDAGYSLDGKHIFSISSVGEERGIYDFDLKKSKINPIMMQKNGFINNIQVIN